MDRNLIILAAIAVIIWAPVSAVPPMPTELDLNLLNTDGSNIDTGLLLTIDYTDGDGNPQSVDSVNNAGNGEVNTILRSIYDGKSNLYSNVEAKGGTDITITVDGYEPLNIIAVEAGYVSGDYYLNNLTPIPSTTTTTSTTITTAPTTTSTTTTTVPTTTTTTLPSDEDGASHVATTVFIKEERIVMTASVIGSGSAATFNVPSSEESPLRQLVLKVDNEVKDVELTVSVLTEKPADVETDVGGVPYRYINISHTISDAEINSATVKFNVEKSWINENSIDPDSMTLDRYSGSEWTALPTTRLPDDLDYYVYEAVSPGLSVFRISGSVGTDALTTTTVVTQAKTLPPTPTAGSIGPLITTVPPKGNELRKALLVILAFAIVAFAAYYLRKR